MEDMIRYEQEKIDVDIQLAGAEARLRALEVMDGGEDEDVAEEIYVGEPKHDSKVGLIEDQHLPTLDPHAVAFNYSLPDHPVQNVHSLPHSTPDNIQPVAQSSPYSIGLQQDISQQQANLSKLLIEAQLKSSLPQRKIPVFDGNPLEYVSWLSSFDHGVDGRCTSDRERLYYLEQFTAGAVKRLVRSYMQMKDQGYQRAKTAIAERYGNKFRVASAFLKEVESFPNIKSEDGALLNDFSLLLLECKNTMESLGFMAEVNHTSQIRMLISKLPFKLREKWRTITSEIQERRMVTFTDLVQFVSKQAKIAANPIYGEIKESRDNEGTRKSRPTATTPPRKKAFASSVQQGESSHRKPTTECACGYCNMDNHTLENCRKLQRLPISERLAYLKTKGLCFGCLRRASHMRKDCKAKLSCNTCNSKHPTVLHDDASRDNTAKTPSTSNQLASSEKTWAKTTRGATGANDSDQLASSENTGAKTTCGVTGAGDSDHHCKPIILPLLVRAKDTGVSVKTYAFLDDGSNAVFCSQELHTKLKTNGERTKLSVETINETETVDSVRLKNLEVMDMDGNNVIPLPEVYTHLKIPATKDDIVTAADLKQWPYLRDIDLPEYMPDTQIGLLIGNNVPEAMEPLHVINSKGDGSYACNTRLGWAVYGIRSKGKGTAVNRLTTKQVIAKDVIEAQLVQMYNHEFSESLVNDQPERSQEEQLFMVRVSDSITIEKGLYQIGLPFKHEDVSLPNNRPIAEQRAAHLRRKLLRNPDFLQEYTTFMNGMLQKGHAERVLEDEEDGIEGRVWYVPHHGVYHPQKKKIRVVFDCGAEYKGKSLNKELLQGPDLTSNLIGVLLRFRKEQIALMADIESMFYQVRVPRADHDMLRFLWWPGGDVGKPIQVYRMAVHVFGATSSPACANYALRRAAEDAKDHYDPAVGDTIRQNFYVDDCLKSIASTSEAICHVKDLRSLCAEKGFKLTKWISNSREVIQTIPSSERAKETQLLDLAMDDLPTERALGVLWSAQTDSFYFNINIKHKPPTRRGILSMVSSIYDPLGFISPCTLPAKIMMQDLCRLKLAWDEEIPRSYLTKWQDWLYNIPQLSTFSLERCIKPSNFLEPIKTELHHFSDASEVGYGTATYIRFEDACEHVHCQLLLAKSRVAPLKQMTIPRLELAAATVSVRLDNMLRKELQVCGDSFFWTDSTSVLRYINNKTARFHTFVANRLAVILEGSKPHQWRYVPTDTNPADECSRGQTVNNFLKNRRWVQGPEFLQKSKDQWPQTLVGHSDVELSEDPEVKRSVVINKVQVKESSEALDRLITYFSSWYRLKRAVGWIIQVKKSLLNRIQQNGQRKSTGTNKKSRKKEIAPLSVEDLLEAEEEIVKLIQRQFFSNEIESLMIVNEYM